MSKKIFNINNSLYPEKIIQTAIHEFYWYDITYTDQSIIIDDDNPQEVFDELMNYILSIFSENIVWA